MGDDLREQRSTEWNAAEYHRLANPHVTWGQRVLDGLQLSGNETVVDAGCGSGRLTAELLDRLPDGQVIAVDISLNMLDEAKHHLQPRYADRVRFVQSDLLNLELDEHVDAVFSTAAFHWVLDHPQLFRRLFCLLKPGGLLVAQCGGGPNIAVLLDRASKLMVEPPYVEYFSGWTHPWEFADDVVTANRLEQAGFVEIETWLEETPVYLPDRQEYEDYLETVVFGDHLERLEDDQLKIAFVTRLAEQAASDVPPYTLDYWRLNMRGQRPL